LACRCRVNPAIGSGFPGGHHIRNLVWTKSGRMGVLCAPWRSPARAARDFSGSKGEPVTVGDRHQLVFNESAFIIKQGASASVGVLFSFAGGGGTTLQHGEGCYSCRYWRSGRRQHDALNTVSQLSPGSPKPPGLLLGPYHKKPGPRERSRVSLSGSERSVAKHGERPRCQRRESDGGFEGGDW
jgi:hypothetical protein